MPRLEQALREAIAADPPAAAGPMGELFAAGGKRLRPALVLLGASLGEYDFDRVAPAAIAVELLHATTLVHDDVIDRSPSRRGRPTVFAQAGAPAAILVGDYYFSKAYHWAALTGRANVVAALSDAVMQIVDGELAQQADRYRYRPTREQYLRRIELKTATLLAAACTIGAELGGCRPAVRTALHLYGLRLGFAFQVVDDMLDYTGQEAELGKPVGHDLLEGSATLPLMLAWEDPAAAPILARLLRDGVPLDADQVAQVVAAVRASSAVEATLEVARGWVREATAALAAIQPSAARTALESIAEFVVERRE